MSGLRSRKRVFEEMGLGPEWGVRRRQDRVEKAVSPPPFPLPETVAVPAADIGTAVDVRSDTVRFPGFSPEIKDIADWDALVEVVGSCTRCGLCKTRVNVVPGVGDTGAAWLFVGEGPGYHEDQKGEPFVGRSGMLLDNMLAAIGVKRGEDAYIANIVKCRASNALKKDRPPTEEEAAACLPYLRWQIEKIRPGIIVALGKTAAVELLSTGREVGMSVLRGKTHRLLVGDLEIPLIVTWHPAYLLRTPMAKKQAWADLCLAMDVMDTAR